MDTIQCPHCGTANDTGRALCLNCQSPLTAYSGQLMGETYEGKLAGQVDRLWVRPLSVNLMTVFLLIIAAGWPVRAIFTAFIKRAHLNADSTNYLASAFGAIGPILTTIICLPLAAILVWLAWAAFTRQVRSWHLSLVAVSAFAVFILFRLSEYRGWAALWLGLASALIIAWIVPATRSWFGLA